MTAPKRKLLVLVHPGSTCGSADFSLGKAEGARIRAALAAELDAWNGDVCVIDGDLSRELRLRRYSDLNAAMRRMFDRCRAGGYLVERREGCALHDAHPRATADLVAERGLTSSGTAVTLTGAWYDPLDRTGCVNDVRKVFAEAGLSVAIGPGAAKVADDWSHEREAEAVVAMFM